VLGWAVSYFGSGARPDGPKPEAQKAESGGGVLGGVWGSAVSSPSAVGDGAPAARRFSCISEVPNCLSWNLLGSKFGRGEGTAPLNPPMSGGPSVILGPATSSSAVAAYDKLKIILR